MFFSNILKSTGLCVLIMIIVHLIAVSDASCMNAAISARAARRTLLLLLELLADCEECWMCEAAQEGDNLYSCA